MNSFFRYSPILALAFATAYPAGKAAAQTPDSAVAVSRAGKSLFRVNVDGGVKFGGDVDLGATEGVPMEGAGTRFMWHPRKAALRVGYVNGTQWDEANIGFYSFAIGENVRASASNAVAMGLRSTAAQQSSFAVGEDNTASGAASVAMGYHAHTNARQGSFVFGDRSTVDTIRAGVNHSANWRVSGGFRIFTSSNLSTGVTFQSGASVSNWGQSNAVISTSTGAYLSTGGVWTNASDVNRKYNFSNISGDEILVKLRELPITMWSYRSEDTTIRHIGPMAQDFRRVFGVGNDELSISTVDSDGISFAAIKALDERAQKQEATIEVLRGENETLREKVATMNERLARMEAALEKLQQQKR